MPKPNDNKLVTINAWSSNKKGSKNLRKNEVFDMLIEAGIDIENISVKTAGRGSNAYVYTTHADKEHVLDALKNKGYSAEELQPFKGAQRFDARLFSSGSRSPSSVKQGNCFAGSPTFGNGGK